MTPTRNPARSRSRRVLLWSAGLFFVGQLLSGWAFDYLWPQVRFPELYQNLAHLEAQPLAPTVVCLGSSRFGSFLSETEMTRRIRRLPGNHRAWVFNASVPGGDSLTSERTLQELLQRGARPRYALLEMCPPAIAERNPWPWQFAERQLRWSDIPTHAIDLARDGQLLRLVQFRLVPLYAHRGRICKEVTKSCVRWREAGRPIGRRRSRLRDDGRSRGCPDERPGLGQDHPSRPPHEDQLQASRAAIPYLTRVLRDYQPGGTLVAALDRTVRLCRDNGIEPILVGAPVTSSFRECVTPEMEARYREFLEQFCRRHACLFVDYSSALPDSFFIDYHHAGIEGNVAFSRQVTAELLVPLLLGRQPAPNSSAWPQAHATISPKVTPR